MGYLNRKRVFITGGSSGIGLSVALRLAAAGAHVAIAARGADRLESALAEIRANAARGDQVLIAKVLDVTDRQAVKRVAVETLDELGGLDILIANAGTAQAGWLQELPDSAFDEQVKVNYLGHVNVVRAFLPHLMAQGHGDICLVSSMLGAVGSFGYTAYCGSKFAVAGFAEALRHELHPHGVRVTLFYPPTTETPGLERENVSKPLSVWLFESDSGFNKVHEADAVARALLGAIEKGRFGSTAGLESRLLLLGYRHLPGLARRMADRGLREAVRKAERRGA